MSTAQSLKHKRQTVWGTTQGGFVCATPAAGYTVPRKSLLRQRRERIAMEQWFYAAGKERMGPVSGEALSKLIADSIIRRDTLVWKAGMSQWAEAGTVAGLFGNPPTAASAPAVPAAEPEQQPPPHKGLFENIGAKISEVARVPQINDVPVGRIFSDGLSQAANAPMEEIFVVGTPATTPPLAQVQTSWPRPRACWVILAGAAITYALLRMGLQQYNNPNFIPGMLVIGAFVVPLTVVVFFFEMNTPKNVSIYQTSKMLFLGGALSLIATLILATVITGSGVGQLVPAMLTGLIEETAKAIALLLIVRNVRYPWQLNGILFGAAVGAGFAGLESAGYAFRALFSPSGYSVFDSIMMRAILSPGGHVIWTAMIGSAIWKVKRDRQFEFSMLAHPVVIRRFLVAVVLHGLWDTDIISLHVAGFGVQYIALFIVGWVVMFGILKDALQELANAKSQLPSAPTPSLYVAETMIANPEKKVTQ